MSANEIRIEVYGENKAGPAFKEVQTDADKTGKSIDDLSTAADKLGTEATKSAATLQDLGRGLQSVAKSGADDAFKKTAHEAENAGREVKAFSEKTDELDTIGSGATSSLGALGSGFELIGKTGVQEKLEQIALATDFLSGAGEAATIVQEKFGGALKALGSPLTTTKAGLSKVKEGFSDASSTAGKVTTGVLAAGAAFATLAATGAILNAVLDDKVNVSMHDTVDGMQRIAQGGKITDDSLKGFSSSTKILDHDLASLNGGFEQHIKNLGDSDLGLSKLTGANKVFDEASSNTSERLGAVDDALTELVSKGQADTAAQAFEELSKQAKAQGVSVEELSGGLPKYTEAAKNATDATNDANDATMSAVDALNQQDDALHEVSDSLKAATDPMFALTDAQENLDDKTKAYNDAVKKSGKNSREAKDANDDLNQAYVDVAGSLVNATNGTGHLTDKQKKLLSSAGASKDRIKELDTQLYNAWKQANKLDDFNIDINYNQHFNMFGKPYSQDAINRGQVGGLASGGLKGASDGRMGGGLTWTGEHGPELLDLPPGTSVKSNPDSMRMMAASGSGSSQPIIVQLVVDGKVLAEAMADPMRDQIRRESGGNVQQHLGRNF